MTTENTATAASPVLDLNLSVAEVNTVLGALSQLPYKQSSGAIDSMMVQAKTQFDLDAQSGSDVRPVETYILSIRMTPEQVNLCLGALSELPYNVSANLIRKIKEQGDSQLAALAATGDPAPAEKLEAEPVDSAS